MTTNTEERIFGLLGLARRAGQIVDGQERIVQALSTGSVHLLILSQDAGANGRKKLEDKANTYQVKRQVFSHKRELGYAIGRNEAAAIAITDAGFAKKLEERFGELHGGGAFDKSPSL